MAQVSAGCPATPSATEVGTSPPRSIQNTHSNNTSHDDGNDTLDQQVWAEDTHSGDTDTRLGGTVTGAEAFMRSVMG